MFPQLPALTHSFAMSADWLLFVGLVLLFFKLRKLKPWIPYPGIEIDSTAHAKPIKELIISETWICLTTIPLPIILLLLLQTFAITSDSLIVKKFVFGLVLFFDAVLILKLMVCRPRPNAIAIEANFKQHKQEISMKMDMILESRQSFPSAHAYLAAFASTFFIIVSLLVMEQGVVASTVQLTLFLLGTYPGICQANTHWHHWSDVIAGHVIGSIAAVYSYFVMLSNSE